MSRDEILAQLGPHSTRPIRAFLADKRVTGSPAEAAFWEVVYRGETRVDHAEALRIGDAMEAAAEPVGRVLEGWRP